MRRASIFYRSFPPSSLPVSRLRPPPQLPAMPDVAFAFPLWYARMFSPAPAGSPLASASAAELRSLAAIRL